MNNEQWTPLYYNEYKGVQRPKCGFHQNPKWRLQRLSPRQTDPDDITVTSLGLFSQRSSSKTTNFPWLVNWCSCVKLVKFIMFHFYGMNPVRILCVVSFRLRCGTEESQGMECSVFTEGNNGTAKLLCLLPSSPPLLSSSLQWSGYHLISMQRPSVQDSVR